MPTKTQQMMVSSKWCEKCTEAELPVDAAVTQASLHVTSEDISFV